LGFGIFEVISAIKTSDRPVPRWLHAWAVLTVLGTLVLLVLGQFVTSFRAGMADPIWPTEPWYLFIVRWQEPNRGYLIEHSHRIAGFLVGALMSVLALGLWWSDYLRWVGMAAIVILLGSYGEFHGSLMAQRNVVEISIPVRPVVTMLGAFGALVALGIAGMAAGMRGAGVRLLGILALGAVMIQGLLGGFRVRLDALFGPELAPIHGIFAQIVFCLLVSLAALTGRPSATILPEAERRRLGRLSFSLVAALFVQLIWGAMVRHAPNALNQRLHLLTAFIAVALAVWLLRVGFTTAARPRIAFTGWVLGILIALQVVLGVEAWMGKFGEEARAGQSAATHLPEAASVSTRQAAMRTAHTLVGTGVLAAAVVFALRIRARTGDPFLETEAAWDRAYAPEPAFALTGKMS
jgi:cytochrome c oxidase assembly protein subunit 15